MGLRAIAEFVEREAVRQELAAIWVDYEEEFGIATPEPLEEVRAVAGMP